MQKPDQWKNSCRAQRKRLKLPSKHRQLRFELRCWSAAIFEERKIKLKSQNGVSPFGATSEEPSSSFEIFSPP